MYEPSPQKFEPSVSKNLPPKGKIKMFIRLGHCIPRSRLHRHIEAGLIFLSFLPGGFFPIRYPLAIHFHSGGLDEMQMETKSLNLALAYI